MGNRNSEVRHIDKREYNVNASEYMKAYSFILSWGWKREKIGGVWYWISKDKKFKTQNIQEASLIQSRQLRLHDEIV
ncbi:MAG: hypothetical protein WDA47_09300 [Bacilli bacterium]|jgi:hypothetical protein